MSDRHVTRMTIHDALHYSAIQRAKIIASYPPHVRKARTLGQPAIGEGAVFPLEREEYVCAPFDIPPHWMEIAGLDFGWDHPTAAVRIVFDRESETFYAVQEYGKRQTVPLLHCETLKGWGKHLPFAWGSEGLQTKLSDDPKQQYKVFQGHGLRMLDSHATFDNGGVGVERGVQEILELMMAGKFKIFRTCPQLIEEISTYHRAKKQDSAIAVIVKVHDDRIDAMRYAYMMRRFAVPVSWRARWGGRPSQSSGARRNIDSRDIFTGGRGR